MSKMMILGLKGETGLWLVDFEAGVVTALDGKREDYITSADGVAAESDTADVAVAFEPKEAAFSGVFFKAAETDVAAAFEAKETAFSSHFFNTTSAADVAVAFEPKEAAFSGRLFNTAA
ncbi:hypothetical protein QA648_15785 [Rhizobium sp. CB3171]|uniref:hypothetical protein n=1 Tax=Rhizobium sp. CB3171 TaxID=3039157 RepID=UPI0024B187F5|nr:hypothetical protein [Rhizobium sp. CB3171]WFU01572.1 hypothetical protein QA648_15785 [Rhizobium sp. CB3171]